MSRKLIEAALFMSSRPMTAEEISKITSVPLGSVEQNLRSLQKEYEDRGMEIIQNPEGWHMRVRPEFLPKVARLAPYSDLKDGHKRTLALVAYKEPIKQSEIVEIQGNKSYAYIRFLKKKGLIKTEKKGRTVNVTLTKEFERYFGADRQKIKAILENAVRKIGEKKGVEKAKETAGHAASAEKPVIRAGIKAEILPAKTEMKMEAASAEPKAEAAEKKTNRRKIRKSPAAKIGTMRPGV